MDSPDQLDFEWGKKGVRGGVNGDVQFYESFRFDGVEYCLYDSVYIYTDDQAIPHVGKLLKMWELASKVKKVKVVWFFRPEDVSNYACDLEVHPKELFLACGTGNGLTNINSLEAIAGKCEVICTSKDERNRQPSLEEVNMADHIFSRTFDVEKLTFSDNLGVKIADVDVKLFFNKSAPETYCTPKTNSYHEPDIPSNLKVSSSTPLSNDKRESNISKDSQRHIEQSVKRKFAGGSGVLDTQTPKAIKIGDLRQNAACDLADNVSGGKLKASKFVVPTTDKKVKGTLTENPSGASLGLSKMIKNDDKMASLQSDKLRKTSLKQMNKKIPKLYGQTVDVTRRPDVDRSKWFTDLAWGDRVKAANTEGTLVLLQNLDPTYTASDVEDIVWHGFRESCSAKMIPSETAGNPPRGDAFIIMKTKDAAERIVQELQEGCLLLPNGRLLMGRTGVLVFPTPQTSFPGHLVIARIKLQLQRENREAVSTSHSTQPNTLEYDMAMEWRLLQERFDDVYKKLFKQQREELRIQKEKLMVRCH